MDIGLWFGWICSLFVLMYLASFALAGAAAFRSPAWNPTLHRAAGVELTRRGYFARPTSTVEDAAAAGMCGTAVQSADEDEDSGIVDLIRLLGCGSDDDEMVDDLDSRRDAFLETAVRRQFARVENVADLRLASRLWRFQRFLNELEIGARGAWWLGRLSLDKQSAAIRNYATQVAFGATLLGVVWWTVGTALDASDRDLLTTVAKFTGCGAFLGALFAIAQFWRSLLVLRWGPISRWTGRGVLTGAGLVAVVSALFLSGVSGAAAGAAEYLARATDRFTSTGLSVSIGGVLLIAALLWVVWRSVSAMRRGRGTPSERLGTAAVAVFLMAMTVPVALMVLRLPLESAFTASAWVAVVGGGLLGGAAMLAWCREWWVRYRTLVDAGYPLRRYGFRWSMLLTWSVAFAVFAVLAGTADGSNHRSSPGVEVVVECALAVLAIVVVLLLPPGLVVTYLFVRRVNAQYQRREMERHSTFFDAGTVTRALMESRERGSVADPARESHL
ncbi:hypothetical protein ACWDUM_17815 [Rhodococcus sp. NPDC003322]